jgi:hypothetical protein
MQIGQRDSQVQPEGSPGLFHGRRRLDFLGLPTGVHHEHLP